MMTSQTECDHFETKALWSTGLCTCLVYRGLCNGLVRTFKYVAAFLVNTLEEFFSSPFNNISKVTLEPSFIANKSFCDNSLTVFLKLY